MTANERTLSVGDATICFLFDERHRVIHKIPGIITAQRGVLWGLANLNGNNQLAVNVFLNAHLKEGEGDLRGGRFHNLSDDQFDAANDIKILSHTTLQDSVLDWLADIGGRWSVHTTIRFRLADSSVPVPDHRETYLSFENTKDAIHYKLRWTG